MGLGLFSTSSLDSDWDKNFSVNLSSKAPFIKVEQITEVVRTTPDPTKFTVDAVKQVGNHLVLRLFYDEATNYEGKKILVYKGVTYMELVNRNKGIIDPHFSSNNEYGISPFARFEPTNEGWREAINLCNSMIRNN